MVHKKLEDQMLIDAIHQAIQLKHYRVLGDFISVHDLPCSLLIQQCLSLPFDFDSFQLCFLEDEECCKISKVYLYIESPHIGVAQVDTSIIYPIKIHDFDSIHDLM